MDTDQHRETLSVVEAGRRLGIGRGSAYRAARRGDLPVIRVGHRLLVPRRALDRLLGVEPERSPESEARPSPETAPPRRAVAGEAESGAQRVRT